MLPKATSLFASLALVGAVSLSMSASARSVHGFYGASQVAAEASCFTNGNGAVTKRSCSAGAGTTRRWCVALPIDRATSHSVQINGLRPNGGTLACHATSTARDLTSVRGTGNVLQPIVDASADLRVGSLPVSDNGALFTCCDLSDGARLNTVTWNGL